jgi:hypothetical protein
MLRLAIRAIAALWLIGAIVATIWRPFEWPMLIPPAIIVLGSFYEKRYTGVAVPQPGTPDFRPTGERFVDPETGRLTIVHSDPRTGERRYIEAGEPPVARP